MSTIAISAIITNIITILFVFVFNNLLFILFASVLVSIQKFITFSFKFIFILLSLAIGTLINNNPDLREQINQNEPKIY